MPPPEAVQEVIVAQKATREGKGKLSGDIENSHRRSKAPPVNLTQRDAGCPWLKVQTAS
jgi:hypothetical protein